MATVTVPAEVHVYRGAAPLRATGLTAEEAGERILAVLGPCSHPNRIAVDLALTGETVAALCPDCDRQLPASWAPTP